MLNVARLLVLHTVAKHGSLAAAAKELTYTPSAVSQQIALLERETGSRLLDRHPRGVRLTESGRILARHASAVLSELRVAEAALTAVGRGYAGRLRFGSFPTANAEFMPRAVAEFQASHPQVELDLVELDRDEGLTALASFDLDLALVYEFPIATATVPESVETIPLLTDPLYIMLAQCHPLGERDTLALSDLADDGWIQGVHHGSTIDVLPRACRAAGFEPRILFRTDDQVTVRGLVTAGIGVALAPWLMLSTLPPGVIVRPLNEPALTRTVMAALPTPGRRLPAATAMVDTLSSVAVALGASPPSTD